MRFVCELSATNLTAVMKMKAWFDAVVVFVVLACVAVLAITAIPFLVGGEIHGKMLLLHMMSSGALVFALPVLAVTQLMKTLDRSTSGGLRRLSYWATLSLGFLTIGSVFVCMLPIPSTQQMVSLVFAHGVVGFLMVPATILLAISYRLSRKV